MAYKNMNKNRMHNRLLRIFSRRHLKGNTPVKVYPEESNNIPYVKYHLVLSKDDIVKFLRKLDARTAYSGKTRTMYIKSNVDLTGVVKRKFGFNLHFKVQ